MYLDERSFRGEGNCRQGGKVDKRRIVARSEDVRYLGKGDAILLGEMLSHTLQQLADIWQISNVHMISFPAGIVNSNHAKGEHCLKCTNSEAHKE